MYDGYFGPTTPMARIRVGLSYLESAKKSGVEGCAQARKGRSEVLRFGLSQDAIDRSFADAELGGDDRSG